MAHREQHGNQEAKMPKKNKPREEAQSRKSAVSEVIEAKATAKH